MLRSIKTTGLGIRIVRTDGIILLSLGREGIDVNPAIGVELIPCIGIDDDAGFDLYKISSNSAIGHYHCPEGELHGPTLYLIGLLSVP